MKRSLPGRLLVGCAALAALACERPLAPQRSTIGDLRRQATAGSGSFIGSVRVRDPQLPCWRSTHPMPGVRVEVGLWDGSPAFYRDTVTRRSSAVPNDPRFQLLVATVTGPDGRFRFDSMPRGIPYAMRAIPPRESPWAIGYGESMYGVPSDATIKALQMEHDMKRPLGTGSNGDFPILCVPLR